MVGDVPIIASLIILLSFSLAQDQNTFDVAYGKEIWTLMYYSMSNDGTCVSQESSPWAVVNAIQAQGDISFGTAQVVLAVNIAERKIATLFRPSDQFLTFATTGFEQFITNVPVSQWRYNLTVATPYVTTFEALYSNGLETALLDAWSQYCDFKLMVIGYSIGACLSQQMGIVAANEGLWTPDDIEYYGYDSLRCGRAPFANAMDASSAARYQIRVNDYVNNLPILGAPGDPTNFQHCCFAIQFNKTTTIVPPSSTFDESNPTRCATGEDVNCLKHAVILGVPGSDAINHGGFYNLNCQSNTITC